VTEARTYRFTYHGYLEVECIHAAANYVSVGDP
jgi:hypothetical protein